MTSFILNSQNKTIVPTSGTIVFKCNEVIIDSIKFRESMKNLKKLLISQYKKEYVLNKIEDGEEVDTLQLNLFINSIPPVESMFPVFNNRVKEFHHEFDNDKIKFFITQNSKKTTNDVVIDITKKYENPVQIENNTDENIDVIEDKSNHTFQYSNNKIIEIKEYKEEKKVINGYNCYKVIYSFKDLNDDSSYFIIIREIWVTDKIKTLFHPVVMEKSILEKYYPMQILEYSDELKGFQTNYTLDTFTLK